MPPGTSVSALAAHLGLPPATEELTPTQLRRLSANKASAHRAQSRRHRRAAAKASIVAASLGSGEERAAEMAQAAMDIEALRSTPGGSPSAADVHNYGTRQTTGAITGMNPLIRTEEEMDRLVIKHETDVASNAEEARSLQLDEGACQIVELLEHQKVMFHDNPRIHAALVYVAIAAGDLVASMHERRPKMDYYEAMMRERCERFGEIRSSRLAQGSLLGGYTSGALARAVSHTHYVDSLRAVVRLLTGTTRVTHVTAEYHLRELMLEEVPYVQGDTAGKKWHLALFTLGGHIRAHEVETHLDEPLCRRRAMEGMLPVILWRYVQVRRGVGPSYAKDLQAAAAAAAEARSIKSEINSKEVVNGAKLKGDEGCDPTTERRRRLESKAAKYEKRMKRIVDEMRSLSTVGDVTHRVKGKANRDTASSAAYESDEYEPSEWDEYSRNSSARYGGSFLVRDGEGETPTGSHHSESKDSDDSTRDSESSEDGSSDGEDVSGLTMPQGRPSVAKAQKGDDAGKGKGPNTISFTIPSALARFFRSPQPHMRWEQQWPLEKNPKLLGVWARAIDFFRDPLLAQNANVFALLAEVQSPYGLILGDMAGFAYGYKCRGSIELKKVSSRLSCSPLLNPDHDVRIQNVSTDQSLVNHMFPRCYASLQQFFRRMSDQAVQPSRIRFKQEGPERQAAVRRYEERLDQLIFSIFAGCTAGDLHRNPYYVTRWALILGFHIKLWMRALVVADASVLDTEFDAYWRPHELYLGDLHRLTPGEFVMHLEFLGIHCRLCGMIAQVESCCSNPKCTHARGADSTLKANSSADSHVVTEAEYQAKLDRWQEQRMQVWEKGGAKGNAPKKDKAAFTKETKYTTRPKATASKATVEDYYDQQDRLPYFTWNRSSGFAMVRPAVL